MSDNGEASWTVLENFTGISRSVTGTRSFDISAFISTISRVRFRVNNLYGGRNEDFLVDNVQIEFSGSLVPLGTAVDLVVSLGPAPGGDDHDDGDDDD